MAAGAGKSVTRFGLRAIGAALVALIACPAMAEDKAVPVYTPPALAPAASWTGFYVGANVGANWNNDQTIISSSPTFVNGALLPFGQALFNAYTAGGNGALPANSSGQFMAGGQIGYNYQVARLVLGIEADIQSGSHSNVSPVTSTTASGLGPLLVPISGNVVSSLTAQRSLDYLGTVRGRIGGLVTPTLLAYGTGGLAYGHVRSAVDIEQQAVGALAVTNVGSGGAFSQMRTGWTIGGGVEWMFVPNWMAKLEYLHYDLGSVSYGAGTRTSVALGATLWTFVSNTTTRFSGDLVRVGVDYKFDWPR